MNSLPHPFSRSPGALDGARRRTGPSQDGFSLVELMIAMALGLVIIGVVVSVFLSNRQTYQANQALNEVQANARTAFAFMAHDIRNAGTTSCGNTSIANVLNNATTWWASLTNPIVGYSGTGLDPSLTTGTAATDRVANTPSLQLVGLDGNPSTLNDNQTAASFSLNGSAPNWSNGDLLVVCDPDHAAIFQLGGGGGTRTLTYANGGTPGNCSTGLGMPTTCDGSTGNYYSYVANSQIDRLYASDWYLGYNTAGGKSLYRLTLRAGAMHKDEMVRGVTAMGLSYLVAGTTAFVPASSIANWGSVTAVQITLTLQGSNPYAGTNAQPITRTFTSTITLRNRVD